MLLHPAQSQIAQDTHRFRVLVCGRKFGKTSLCAYELIGVALGGNDRRVMYVAPTLGDARRLMWDKLKQILGRAIAKENDTRLELTVSTPFGGQSKIFLGSWELVQNYRGDEFDFVIFDEVQDYRNFWVGWEEAMRPTLTPRKGSALFSGTPKGFNHFFDLYNLRESDTDFASFKFSSYENPTLDRGEIEKAKQQLLEDRFAQEYLADFRKNEGLVFKEFTRETNVFTEPVHGFTERLAGIDFGFTNPTAVIEILVKDGSYYVSNELYRTGMTDEEVAEYVAVRHFHKVYPDPESPAAIESMRRKKVNLREVKKGKDSIQHGINTVRELFKQNRLYIHASCINLISELETYSYSEKRPSHNANENPLDEYNHAIDALRYVLDNHSTTKPFIQRPFQDKMVDIWRGN